MREMNITYQYVVRLNTIEYGVIRKIVKEWIVRRWMEHKRPDNHTSLRGTGTPTQPFSLEEV